MIIDNVHTITDNVIMANKKGRIDLRITEEEKTEMLKLAKREGFDSLSSFLLWLYRQFKNKKR